MGENQNERDEEQPLSCRRQGNGAYRLADGLKHHVAQDDPGSQRQGNELPAQGTCSGYDDVRVVAEPRYDFGREDVTDDGTDEQKDSSRLYAEPESLTHTVEQSGTVVEAAYRLESLSETDEEGVDEHADTGYDRHTRNGCVAVDSGCYVQQDGRQAGQSLTAERGTFVVDDIQ